MMNELSVYLYPPTGPYGVLSMVALIGGAIVVVYTILDRLCCDIPPFTKRQLWTRFNWVLLAALAVLETAYLLLNYPLTVLLIVVVSTALFSVSRIVRYRPITHSSDSPEH